LVALTGDAQELGIDGKLTGGEKPQIMECLDMRSAEMADVFEV
jgi:hypothetical protein